MRTLLVLLLVACGNADPDPADTGLPDDTDVEDTDNPGDTDDTDDTDNPGDTDDTDDTGPVAGDTWDNFAEGFFGSYCTGCHNSGAKNFRNLSAVESYADAIRCRVSPVALGGCNFDPLSMPPNNAQQPSTDARERIVAWIEDGLP